MRRSLLLLALLALAAAPLVSPAQAQRTDRKALEAAIDAVPPGQRTVYVSPLLGQTEIRGNVVILEEEQAILEERFGARFARPEGIIECKDPRRPETCRMPENSVLYQFLMPDPIDEQGVLTIRLVRLMADPGQGGRIHREAWLMALGRRGPVGWDVLGKELVEENEGPW